MLTLVIPNLLMNVMPFFFTFWAFAKLLTKQQLIFFQLVVLQIVLTLDTLLFFLNFFTLLIIISASNIFWPIRFKLIIKFSLLQSLYPRTRFLRPVPDRGDAPCNPRTSFLTHCPRCPSERACGAAGPRARPSPCSRPYRTAKRNCKAAYTRAWSLNTRSPGCTKREVPNPAAR